MNLEGFVRIVARNGTGLSKTGTGYRVRAHRILTAAHVVAGAEHIDLFTESATDAPSPAQVEWAGTEAGLDVALLACEPGGTSHGLVTSLADSPLRETARWESRGYPRSATPKVPLVGLSGEAYAFTRAAATFEVTVSAATGQVDDWRGISGAPVFVGQRLLGVVGEAPQVHQGGRLHSTPSHLLLTNPGFRAALGKDECDERRERLLADIRQLLTTDGKAAEELSRVGAARGLPGWKSGFAGGGAIELGREIAERTPVFEVLMALNAAHLGLSPASSGGGSEAAATIERLLERVVPLVYERSLAYELPEGGAGLLLRLGVKTDTLVEIAMAGLDGRPFRFLPLSTGAEYPKPKGSLPEPPEAGIDPRGTRAFEDFVFDLVQRTPLDPDDKRQLTDPQVPEERRLRDAVRLLNGHYEWEAQHIKEPLRYYFILRRLSTGQHEGFIRRLREALPAIRLVEPTGDDLVAERELSRPLRDLLFRAQTSQRERP